MITGQVLVWTGAIVELAIPAVIFSARPVAQVTSFRLMRSVNPGYKIATKKYKAANTNKKEAKKEFRAAKKAEDAKKDDVASLKENCKSLEKESKRLKKLRKKAAPRSRAASRVIGITASFTVAAATLSGLQAHIDMGDDIGVKASLTHTQKNQWFSLGPFGLGSTSVNTIMTGSYSPDKGFSGSNKLGSYKYYPELIESFAHTVGTGSLLYLGFMAAMHSVRRRRSKTLGSSANLSLKVLSYTLPPLAYLSASGFQIHPEWESHRNTTRIAINFDYDEEKALISLGQLHDLFTVNGTYDDFTIAYIRLHYTSGKKTDGLIDWAEKSFEWDSEIHPKVVSAFKKADEQKTSKLKQTIEDAVPENFGRDTVIKWVEGQVFGP